MSDQEGHHLDPTDWEAFGQSMHQVLEACLQRMQNYRQLPWRPPSLELPEFAEEPSSHVYQQLVEDIMPLATGNTHGSFFGWVGLYMIGLDLSL